MSTSAPDLAALHVAVKLACQPQNTGLIVAGRNRVLSLQRPWVLEHIEQVAAEELDLTDYWQYRRFLELAELLSSDIVDRMVGLGSTSFDPDVREAAEDFTRRA